jgi:glucosamine--fructose-6-phosphate aminotransferase (isomerizing)
VPLCAGTETSVAATKSCLCALAACAQLIAHWSEDAGLLAALATLPTQLQQAWEQDWSALVERLVAAQHLLVLGRGPGLGVAQEVALKLKETCALHAEAFSGAEVRHGPLALLCAGVPALILAQDDESRSGLEVLASDLVAAGVRVAAAGITVPGALLLPASAAHPALAPLLLAQSFYRSANQLALARGLDPDRPAGLRKVTETL